MTTRIASALAVAASLLSPIAAQSAESLALNVLGFSPDGRHFAFMQYGPQWEASRFAADVVVIDANRDRFVQGSPVRVTADMKDDANEDNIAADLKAFLAKARQRAGSLLNAHKVSKPGILLLRVAEARPDEFGSGSDRPPAGVPAATAKHDRLGEFKLQLHLKEIDWPKTSKLGPHKEAGTCSSEVDWQKGAGVRLTLEVGGREIVLNDDKTIPASRHCVTGYGIAEVHAFDRPDGKVTLAVMLGMEIRGFEGQDRLFLAVTKVIDR